MVSTTEPVDIGKLISREPGVWHGSPIVAGTRITVVGIISLHDEGVTAEDIASRKHLTLAQVYAALAYFHANREQIEKVVAEEQVEYDRLAEEARRTESRT
jgi:uncharacterized protein (DUF433 family)